MKNLFIISTLLALACNDPVPAHVCTPCTQTLTEKDVMTAYKSGWLRGADEVIHTAYTRSRGTEFPYLDKGNIAQYIEDSMEYAFRVLLMQEGHGNIAKKEDWEFDTVNTMKWEEDQNYEIINGDTLFYAEPREFKPQQ